MAQQTVTGGGGLALRVAQWGRPDGPEILLVHGWSQAMQCWSYQYGGSLAEHFRVVAFDLRGHGASAKPEVPEAYRDGDLWAADVAAVIEALALRRPVLVGWSYGGLVCSDYLRVHGTGRVAGVNFVCAATRLNPEAFGTLIGPGFLEPYEDATCDDLGRNIAGMRRFVNGCFVRKIPRDDYENCLCWNMAVPPAVRLWMTERDLDFDPVLRGLDVPVLVTQGSEDHVVLPAMAEHIVATCPNAALSSYAGTGHSPFLEDASRFNDELAAFTTSSQR